MYEQSIINAMKFSYQIQKLKLIKSFIEFGTLISIMFIYIMKHDTRSNVVSKWVDRICTNYNESPAHHINLYDIVHWSVANIWLCKFKRKRMYEETIVTSSRDIWNTLLHFLITILSIYLFCVAITNRGCHNLHNNRNFLLWS